jgi:serine-type D-Ala-D-Ala carboxypeptidase (penicillin-binding protein 5/6)
MKRRITAIIFIVMTLYIVIMASIFTFTPISTTAATATGMRQVSTPTLTLKLQATPTPIPTPIPILTATQPLPQFDAAAVYLLDTDSGHVLYDKNGEKPMLMASTTKIMTALIALQTANLNSLITVHQDAINRVILDDGSSSGLVAGDVLPLKDLLYALLLPSGNDAAYAIADGLAGSVPNFVARMNLLAYRLHLFQTHYNSPDGLTSDETTHYTSAHDLAILSQYAMHIPLFASIVKTQTYTVYVDHQTFVWHNTNTLLGTYTGITGIKTGHTDAAGYCLVFSATRSGHHLIGIILGSPSQQQRDTDAAALLNWGFHLPLRSPQ